MLKMLGRILFPVYAFYSNKNIVKCVFLFLILLAYIQIRIQNNILKFQIVVCSNPFSKYASLHVFNIAHSCSNEFE